VFRSLFLVGVLGACGEPVAPVYSDVPTVALTEDDELRAGEQVSITAGVLNEQLFNELEAGDPLHIINGFQGGTWVHVSIRVTGMRSRGRIDASLGEGVGETAFELKLIRTAQGFMEAHDIPIPVRGDVDDLVGQEAVLQLTYTSREEVIDLALPVVLERG
jgi:hypothetical protein